MSDTKENKEEQFREEQRRQAAEQNKLGANAVPEQRPQSFTEPNPSNISAVEARNRENPAQPATLEDYDRARSKSQKSRAKRDSKRRRFLNGETVRIVAHDDELMVGRKGVITDIQFTPEGLRDARSGVPSLHDYAEVEYYTVTTRDEGPYQVQCTPKQIALIDRGSLSGRDTFVSRVS